MPGFKEAASSCLAGAGTFGAVAGTAGGIVMASAPVHSLVEFGGLSAAFGFAAMAGVHVTKVMCAGYEALEQRNSQSATPAPAVRQPG